MGLPTIAVPQYTLDIPSTGQTVKYRPFLVKEEKILLLALEGEDQKETIIAIKTIIENCVYGDMNVNTMAMFDLEYIFLKLRGKSKGEIVNLKYECPKCKTELPVALNIDEVNVDKNPENTLDIKLSNDLGVMMKYPTLELQHIMEKVGDDNKQVELIFETIVKCIDYIYDKENTYPSKDHTEKEMKDFIESLTDEYFQKIMKFFETLPALRHKVELHCTKKKKDKICNYKEQVTLEGLQSFFG